MTGHYVSTDAFFLSEAYRYAVNSPDRSTQNAAVVVANNQMLITGINTFPKGVAETDERLERPLKYQFIEHAERNAIYGAARYGIYLDGATMYCPWAPCIECARAIIQAGISELVTHNIPQHAEREDWKLSIEAALEILKEGGVTHRSVSVLIGRKILFDGKIIDV